MKPMKLNWKKILINAAIAVGAIGAGVFGVTYWMDNSNTSVSPMEDKYMVQFAVYRLAEGIPVTLSATSVERDLSIYILDEDCLPVPNIEFQVEATDQEGNTVTFIDEEACGKIYVEELEPGDYMLALLQTDRFIAPEPVTVEVKDAIEHEVIENIAEVIVNAKNVDVPREDAEYGGGAGDMTEAPPPPEEDEEDEDEDTIPFYESKTSQTEKEVNAPLLDANGKQVIKYMPVLNDEGFLLLSSSEASTYKPEVDSNGFCLPTDPVVFGANGQPVTDANGYELYMLVKVPQTTNKTETVTIYQGWQTLDGNKYYFDLDGNPVTGSQVIQGVNYEFDSNGILLQKTEKPEKTEKLTGIDISTYQSGINWTSVRNSGVYFAMIRAGYRGYSTGVLVEDDMFKSHVTGASNAGIKIGIYYFSQAINEKEAVEEASAAVALARKYGVPISYPIAIDIEYTSSARLGRADGLTGEQRTQIAEAFCDTVKNAGYTPMIYSSKSWFESDSKLITSRLAPKYKIWLAHWGVAQTNYKGRVDMWQYTSSGSVPGIPGRVDMNISYLGY